MTALAGVVLFLVAFPTVFAAARVPTRRPVTIYKCCNNNEVMMADQKCLRNESSTWNIRGYDGRDSKKGIHYLKSLPAHWTVVEDHPPKCAQTVRFTSTSYFSMYNGSLFIVDYNRLFHPSQYCLDYYSALLCVDPQNFSLVTVKKCCGPDAILSQTNHSCIHMKDDSYKIDVGQDRTLGYGFPTCMEKMHPVARQHESKILSNGSLLVNDKILLPTGNYCLEHVLEDTGWLADIFLVIILQC